MKKIFVSLLMLSASLVSFAQQDAQFTHYRFNQLYYNPGYAGIKGATTFKLIHRSQWLGYQPTLIDKGGAPTTEMFSADIPSLRFKGGAGFTIMTDQVGPQRYTSFQLNLSKHIDIGTGKLGIGVQGSYAANRFNTNWRPPEEGTLGIDMAIPYFVDDPTKSYTQGFFDAAGGMWYESKDLFAGVGLNRLLNNEFDFNQIGDGGYRKHFYVMAGYNIEASYDLIVTPTLLVKSSFSERGTQFEVGGIATYQEDMWGGLNFRQGEAIGILLGKSFMQNKQLKLGYSIDFTIRGNAAKNLTSHEIMLTYSLPDAMLNTKPIIRTPRFRY